MDNSEPSSSEEQTADVFERLLAECIDGWSSEGSAAVESVCAQHPGLASRLRDRLADLQRLGLLGEEQAPEAIGPYRILGPLGQGGMSVVYLAWDEQLGKRVALKASRTPLSSDDRSRARFRQEISAITSLDHKGIVPLLEVGEAEGRPYFTMEFVPGATLAQLVERLLASGQSPVDVSGATIATMVGELGRRVLGDKPLPQNDAVWPATWIEAVVRWMLEVAEALEHAHARQVIHRDVKPSNVLVSVEGCARLFDMGLARLGDAPGLTRSGDFTGTPYYVSPEQLGGHLKDVDQRTDIFSLGVTLYELLTFRRPFDGPSTAHVFRQIMDKDPAMPRRLEPRLPPDLETICLTALEKNPEARYQSMHDLAADLRRFLEFRPVRARPVGWFRRGVRFMRRSPARATAALLALFVVVGLPAGLVWANRAIADERDLAETSAAEATLQAELSARVTRFVVDLFELTPKDQERAESVTAREILDRGAAVIPTGFEDQPLHRAALMRASGRVYRNMGLFQRALPLLDRAYAIYQRERGVDELETISLLAELAEVHWRVGGREASLALCVRSLEGFERAGHGDHELAVRCRMTFAAVSSELGRPAEAERALQAALDLRSEVGDEDSLLVADLSEELGVLLASEGNLAEARRWLGRSLDIRRASWVPNPGAIAGVLEQLATVHRDLGDEQGAQDLGAQAGSLRSGVARQLAAVGEATTVRLPGQAPEGPFALRPIVQDAFDARFQEGVTALQSGDDAESVLAFTKCLELKPGHPVSAYNLACSHALAGRVELALDWIGKAVDAGFGFLSDGPRVLEKDPDLEPLRHERRWRDHLERMHRERAAAVGYAASPALYVPPALQGKASWPLLVVLHAHGSTKDSVVQGRWRRVADELGFALLAPSASLPVARSVEQGMQWFQEVDDFLEQPWSFEMPVIEGLRNFLDQGTVDLERVFIAGEGHGSLLAADLALTAPGLFRGLLVANGPIVPEVAWQRTLLASSLGLSVRVVLDDRERIVACPDGMSGAQLAERLEGWLPRWGLEEHASVRALSAGDQPSETLWMASLLEMLGQAGLSGR